MGLGEGFMVGLGRNIGLHHGMEREKVFFMTINSSDDVHAGRGSISTAQKLTSVHSLVDLEVKWQEAVQYPRHLKKKPSKQ